MISWFEERSKHRSAIIGRYAGNYAHSNLKELAGLVWPAVMQNYRSRNEAILKEFTEKTGQGLTFTDLAEIWKATKEGKAFKLLVEKDYRRPGFVDRDETQYHLYLHPPVKPHKVITDVIDDIIEMILEKNGEVYFFENGELGEQGRIALITRY